MNIRNLLLPIILLMSAICASARTIPAKEWKSGL